MSQQVPKIVTVFGATGNQGGSVVKLILATPELQAKYKVRAVTRDRSKEAAQKLASSGAELVEANLNDVSSLENAIKGSYAVFGVTNYWESMSKDTEVQQGRNIVDASKAAGVAHLVWSSLPNATKVSGGQLKHIEHFDGKSEVEAYAEQVKGSDMAATYFMPAYFMSNLKSYVQPGPDGVAAWAGPMDADKTNVPLIDTAVDTGKFVIGILEAGPKAADGKHVHGVSEWATPAQLVKTLSDVTGKQVRFNSVPLDIFKGFLPPQVAEELAENMALIGDFDYYGKQAKAEQADSDRFFYSETGPKVSLVKFIEGNGPWTL
ncbi:NmrA-domain-containing protein [Acaromyces ingoldii]|uniref:NmrA-domain-containing protein n=1 Tax=Acaromyces ingoldii TaxID=215250 RepID=A0A316YL06_9BASI|nr:NmrA-domain-containing protein [Acaromyces ingoldii]PWN89494.1 NmrA-domain-containing protein [Acaromyces ingoldii]